jgi:hypothetical protein
MNTEARRQALVLEALWGGSADGLGEGLAAYRGNAAATAERVLAAAYPTVRALLGEEALAGLARQLWQRHPPRHGDLGAWGDALPDWLAKLPEAQAWPYLADCARLDWARHTAERAMDATADAGSLALLGTQDPAALTIALRPGLSVIRSAWPLVMLWEAHQQAEAASSGHFDRLRQALANGQAENAVVWRPRWRAEVAALPNDMADWMAALLAQPPRPLAELLAQAPTDFAFGAWLETALRRGWIWRAGLISGRGG